MKVSSFPAMFAKSSIYTIVSLSIVLSGNIYSYAQAPNPEGDTNKDKFPQDIPIVIPLEPETQTPLQPNPIPDKTDNNSTVSNIEVKKIEVIGSTLFSPTIFNPIIQTVAGKTVSFAELQTVADAITQLYLNQGYITSRAILTGQKITDGIVKIQVVEGSLEKIEVTGNKRLNTNYVRSRIALGAGKPLSAEKLEEKLKLLRSDPLISNVEASLQPGTGVGQSILTVRISEANPFDANISMDNYSPPSAGSERLGLNATHRNLTGMGDKLDISYYFTTQGASKVYDFNYQVPLNAMNGTLQLRASLNNNRVIDPKFKALNIQGESQQYEISYRQPLVRSLKEEFALSLGFSYQDGQTFTFAGPTPFGFGPDGEGNSRTRVFKFAQDYVRRDTQGAWALRSLFSLGTGIFDATINSDPIPDGRFFAWLAQLQRVQRLNQNNLLIAQTEIQLSPNSLLPSQQYIIGGGQSVRGYRQNARAGDNGIKFSLEDRLTVQKDIGGNATLQIAPFIDLGYIWNVDKNPNFLQSQQFLAGTGIGILYQPVPKLNLRLDYALPLVSLQDRGINAQDDGFYFSANYHF